MTELELRTIVTLVLVCAFVWAVRRRSGLGIVIFGFLALDFGVDLLTLCLTPGLHHSFVVWLDENFS